MLRITAAPNTELLCNVIPFLRQLTSFKIINDHKSSNFFNSCQRRKHGSAKKLVVKQFLYLVKAFVIADNR